MKKYIAFLLCLMMLLSLSSCNQNKDQDTLSQAEKSMQMYEAAIKGEICVLDERMGETQLKNLRFQNADTSLDECKLLTKSIFDIDQDGVNEYVIQSPDHEYIILRCYNGNVYSYRLDTEDFYRFNTDGSFHWYASSETGEKCGLSKIIFEGETLIVKALYSFHYSKNPTEYEYFIEGEAVTENEYDSYRSDISCQRIKFSQFELSCSYPITAEGAWNLANTYWDHQDGAADGGAGTVWTAKLRLIDTPNSETDSYLFAFQLEWHSNGGGKGDECRPPYTIQTMDQILVNAFTGEIVASTYDPNGKQVSVEEAIELVKTDCDHIDFDQEGSRYRVLHDVNKTAPDHFYVIVIQKYYSDHYSDYAVSWVDKNTGEVVSPYYM